MVAGGMPMSERSEEEARKLLKRLKDAAKLDHASVRIPGKGDVLIELPKSAKR